MCNGNLVRLMGLVYELYNVTIDMKIKNYLVFIIPNLYSFSRSSVFNIVCFAIFFFSVSMRLSSFHSSENKMAIMFVLAFDSRKFKNQIKSFFFTFTTDIVIRR